MREITAFAKDLLDGLTIAVILETEGGDIVFANVAARALQRELEQADGGQEASSRAWTAARQQARDSGQPQVFTLSYRTAAGTFRTYQGQVAPLDDGLVSQFTDSTEAMVAQQELRAFLEYNPQLPWTSDAEGRVLDVGRRWEEWTGLTLEQGRGSGWLGALHPDDREWVRQTWAEHTRTMKPLDIEYRLRLASGEYGWFRARGTPHLGPEGQLDKWYGTLENVSEIKAAIAAFRESEARFRAIADDAPVMIWVSDAIGGNTYHSRLWRETTGQTDEASRGDGWLDPVHPEDRRALEEAHNRAYAARNPFRFEYRLRKVDGSWAWVIDVGNPRFSDDGTFIGYVGSVLDITERRKAEKERIAAQKQVMRMARHDALTGLPNRLRFAERIEELRSVLRDGKPVAVLLIDLDGFKTINDTLGHPTGDRLLQQVAERLRTSLRRNDVVARVGGDEFAVVVHPVLATAEVEGLAQRIIGSFTAPFRLDGRELVVGASVGVALSPTGGQDSEGLVSSADIALYQAKRAGRGNFQLFDPQMGHQLRAREDLRTALQEAVESKQFVLHYQPIVALADRRTIGYEALLRWERPNHGLVLPGEFIDLADECGLIVPIGQWVIEQALQAARNFPNGESIAVNLSPTQFRNPDLVNSIRRSLAQSTVAPGRLQLEITESVLLNADVANLRVLEDLRDLGVKLALDDFGTGYSSLGYLRSFQFDKLKLDRTFIKDLPDDQQARAIVNAVAGLGRALGIETTAEGVETEAQLQFVSDAGFDEAQGYLLGRPGVLRD